jgi:tetratricopeptide (TPR) repeat protein
MSTQETATARREGSVLTTGGSARELTVKIREYPPADEPPLPSFFSKGWPRNIYPYNRRGSQLERHHAVDLRVIRLANKYIEVDVLPDYGGHVWGARDLLRNREIFHRTDALKHQDLGVAGPWIATGIEFNFPVTHSILTVAKVNSAYGVEPDGRAWARIGATDKLFGLQWQVTVSLGAGVRALDIAAWLHNPTDLEHPYCYWGNAGATVDESLRLYYPFKWSMHHGGQYFKWPGEGENDLSYWRYCKQPISAFGDGGDKRYFGGYYEAEQFGLVHTADPKTLPGKKYFAWGNGTTGQRWAKLLFDNLRDYVELQSGSRTDQEFWNTMKPHSTLWLNERWQPLDAVGGISDANEALTVYVSRENGQAVVRAQSCEALAGVKFRAFTDKAEVARWQADLHPAQVHVKKLDYEGPVHVEADPGRPGMTLKTCDFALIDHGPQPRPREDEFDAAGADANAYRRMALHAMQNTNWTDAGILYAAAQKLCKKDVSLEEEVGVFRLRRCEYAEAKKLLGHAYKAGARSPSLLWGLLKAAWESEDSKLEAKILASIKADRELAYVLSCLRHGEPRKAAAFAKNLTMETLLHNRDLAVAVRVARRRAGVPDKELSDILDDQFPLDPVVRFEANDGSLRKLLETDPEVGIIIAETYLRYGEPESSLKAVEMAAAARGQWRLSDLVLSWYCARRAGRKDAAEYLRRKVAFDPLADRPWQDVFYVALPMALKVLPNDPRIHLLWGNLLQRCGRTPEAGKAWSTALKKGGKWDVLHLSLAIVDWNHKKCSDAEIANVGRIVNRINHPVCYEQYYGILRAANQRQRLLKVYEQHLKIAAKQQAAKSECAQRYAYNLQAAYALELFVHGKFDQAIDYMMKTTFPATHGSMALTVGHIHARCERARSALRTERLAAARKELEPCFRVHNNFTEDTQVLSCVAEANCVLGDVEAAEGNAAKAKEHYEKAAGEVHSAHFPTWVAD